MCFLNKKACENGKICIHELPVFHVIMKLIVQRSSWIPLFHYSMKISTSTKHLPVNVLIQIKKCSCSRLIVIYIIHIYILYKIWKVRWKQGSEYTYFQPWRITLYTRLNLVLGIHMQNIDISNTWIHVCQNNLKVPNTISL